MRARMAPGERLVIWVASSKRDLLTMPVYAVTFKEAVYVLHCFQKKSPRGTKTARTDVELIRERMNAAREDHRQRYEKKEAQEKNGRRR